MLALLRRSRSLWSRSTPSRRASKAPKRLGHLEQLEARLVLAVAVDDFYSTQQQQPVLANGTAAPGVLANDTGSGLMAVLDSGPSSGALQFSRAGTFTYTPSPNFHGVDTFSYRAAEAAPDPQVLPLNATWRYYVPTSNPAAVYPNFEQEWYTVGMPGSPYAGPGFTQSGPALLGYGGIDLGTATVLPTPPSPRYTSYFATTFDFPANPAGVTTLVGQILADDAAVLYLNGVEIYRFSTQPLTNLAAPNPATYATVTGAGAGVENALTTVNIPVPSLQQGLNYLAVSVHQNATGSSDLGWALSLRAPDGTFPPPEQATAINRTVAPTFNNGHVWRHQAQPVAATAFPVDSQGRAWTQAAFDDSAWQSGPAILGFGTLDASASTNNTAIVDGMYGTQLPTGSISYLLRSTFNAADVARIGQLEFDILAEDGAVVYVNGVQAFRDNMPAGTHTANLAASSAKGGAAESSYMRYTVDADGLLVEGQNTIAVALHQGGGTPQNSSDLGFDLALRLVYLPPASNPATVTITVSDANLPPTAVGTQYTVAEDNVLDTLADGRPGIYAAGSPYTDPVTATVDTSSLAGNLVFNSGTGHFVYTPPQNYFGTTSFTFQLTDKDGTSTPGSVTIVVTPVNDAPVAVNDSFSVNQNGQLLLATERIARQSNWFYSDQGIDWYAQTPSWRDPSFNPLAPAVGIPWANGPARLGYGGDGEVTLLSFGPDTNNKIPTYYFHRTIELTADDVAETQFLLVEVVRDDGIVVHFNGVEILRDGMPAGPIGHFTNANITVGAPDETTFFPFLVNVAALPPGTLVAGDNHIAVSVHQVNATSSDLGFDLSLSTIRGTVLANDSDPDGPNVVLTAQLVDGPQNGTLTFSGTGAFNYTPLANFFGTDSFTYRASDGTLTSNLATVTINVLEDPNAPLIAVDDTYAVNEDAVLVVNAAQGLLVNEYGLPLGLTVLANTDPEFGSLVVNSDGSFTYTPNPNFNGTDSFMYLAMAPDSRVSNAATVTINVIATPDPPIVANDAYTTSRGQAINTATQALPSLLANDSAAQYDEEFLPLVVVQNTQGTHGAVVMSANGHFTYTPTSPNFHGSDSFTYVAGLSNTTPLVPRGGTPAAPVGNQVWRYLDNGSDQGTAWKEPGFNDSAWAQGVSELGYGRGNHRTAVSFGPDANLKYVTTYFRTTFQSPASLSNISALLGRVLFDDGVVVYLNGTEIFRQNLPAVSNSSTLATATVDIATTFTQFVINPALLVAGTNVIAAEVHQVNRTSSDLAFDFELAPVYGTTGTVNITINDVAVPPVATNQSFTINEDTTLNGNLLASLYGPGVTASLVSGPSSSQSFSLQGDGTFSYVPKQDFFGSDQFQYRLTNAHGQSGVATASITINPVNDAPVVSGITYDITDPEQMFTTAALAGATLLPAGSTWHYSDTNLNFYASNPPFHSTSFDPSNPPTGPIWLSGPARMGYGGKGEVTVLSFGPDAANKYTTYYFHTTFQLTAAQVGQIDKLLVRLLRDDGAVLHINGRRVIRDNMPVGATHGTFASATVGAPAETTFFDHVLDLTRYPGLLVEGTNRIAVSVHQINLTSSDILFDLSLHTVAQDNRVTSSAFDPDLDLIQAVLVTPPTQHDDQGGGFPFVLNPNGTFTYLPAFGFTGVDTFTYYVTDGTLNSATVTATLNVGSSGPNGDLNNDGRVDRADLVVFGQNFRRSPATAAQGDLNADNRVGIRDLILLRNQFAPPPAPAAAPVIAASEDSEDGGSDDNGTTDPVGDRLPQLRDKILARFDRVLDRIRNPELRDKISERLDQAREAVDEALTRHDLRDVVQSVQQYWRSLRAKKQLREDALAQREALRDEFRARRG
jgi:hypothetical protein